LHAVLIHYVQGKIEQKYLEQRKETFFFSPQQPKVFGVKFSLGKIKRVFSVEIRNLKLWKMPK